MSSRGFSLVALLVSSLLVACGYRHAVDVADAAVSEFHSAYNSGEDDALWDACKRQGPVTREEAERAAKYLRDRFGRVVSSSIIQSRVYYRSGADRVLITYKSKCEKGEVYEHFVFDVADSSARAVAYELRADQAGK